MTTALEMNQWMFNDTPAWKFHQLLGVKYKYLYENKDKK